MPSPQNNEIEPSHRRSRPRRPAPPAWVDMLGAILLGNALYFLLLLPLLPQAWRHQRFVLDAGLGLDFLLCLGLYGLARLLRSKV